MKKIFSLILTIAIIVIVSSNVFAHQGNLDSFGGHTVVQDGFITAYHFHEGRFAGYEIVLTNKIPVCDKEKFMDYVKSLNLEELKKFGTLRKMPTETTTITPSATATPTITISKTETVTSSPKPTIAVTTIATKVLPKTGERENTVMLIAGMFVLFFGTIVGFLIKNKKSI